MQRLPVGGDLRFHVEGTEVVLHRLPMMKTKPPADLLLYLRPGPPRSQQRKNITFEDGFPGVTEPKTALRCSVLWTALTPRV